ncbi:MAG: adenylyltransferase/cytidyltransferase family protein [Halobacteriota archaeon]
MSGRRVLATGTFDVLHPGHLHYLREAKSLGSELVVIVARDSMIEHKPRPVVHEVQRREMVDALEVVDEAVLGSEDSIYEPLRSIQPDVVALGHDQYFGEEELEKELRERGMDADVERVSRRRPRDHEVLSASEILERGCERREDEDAGDAETDGQTGD